MPRSETSLLRSRWDLTFEGYLNYQSYSLQVENIYCVLLNINVCVCVCILRTFHAR